MMSLNETLTKNAREISPFVGGHVRMTFSKDFSKLEKVEADFDNARECLSFCEHACGLLWFKRTSPRHIVVAYSDGLVHDYVDDRFDPMDNHVVHRQFRRIIRILMQSFVEEVNENLPRWKKWHQQEAEAISSAEW